MDETLRNQAHALARRLHAEGVDFFTRIRRLRNELGLTLVEARDVDFAIVEERPASLAEGSDLAAAIEVMLIEEES